MSPHYLITQGMLMQAIVDRNYLNLPTCMLAIWLDWPKELGGTKLISKEALLKNCIEVLTVAGWKADYDDQTLSISNPRGRQWEFKPTDSFIGSEFKP